MTPECDQSRGRRLLTAGLAVALIALIGVGLWQLAGGSDKAQAPTAPLTAAQTRALLASSPAPLSALHAQAGEVLSGGAGALNARLRALRGYPVVINKWASWCVPCAAEAVVFQHAAADLGRRVAFLGIDSGDAQRANGRAFLKAHPVSYPSYYDPSGALGEQVTDSGFTPVTAFFARNGRLSYIHQGQYPSVAKLESDVERYALNA